jgi:hypothetical protein
MEKYEAPWEGATVDYVSGDESEDAQESPMEA